MTKFYVLPEAYFLGLLEDREKLSCLESGGVDNWEWYDASMEEYVEPDLKVHKLPEGVKEL